MRGFFSDVHSLWEPGRAPESKIYEIVRPSFHIWASLKFFTFRPLHDELPAVHQSQFNFSYLRSGFCRNFWFWVCTLLSCDSQPGEDASTSVYNFDSRLSFSRVCLFCGSSLKPVFWEHSSRLFYLLLPSISDLYLC